MQIRPAGGQQSPYYEQLAQATSIAEGGSLGVFGKVAVRKRSLF